MPVSSLPVIRVKPREERRIRAGHPWIYANELILDAEAKKLPPGEMVRVFDAHGGALGVGGFNLHSLIAVRLFSPDADARIDTAFLRGKIRAALALRTRFFSAPFYRLIHAEGDGLPGFIVDRVGDSLILQANTATAERLTPLMIEALQETLSPAAIVLRNDSGVRRLEGLGEMITLAHGALPEALAVEEGGVRFALDPLAGQKTGWYYDLRFARDMLAAQSQGARVLDCYSHTGAFALRAAKAGAQSVLAVDRSELALQLAASSAKANGLAALCSFEKADAFEKLEQLGKAGARFDVVITDPPNFVKSRKDLGPGARAFRKLAKLAAPLVAPGGLWFVACCAHLLPQEMFAKEVAIGLSAAGEGGACRPARILAQGGAGPDHPVHPQVPESAYLKWQLFQLD